MNRIYLDYNATAPLWPSVKRAMIKSFDLLGNPSSVHAFGREAHGVIESARKNIANFFNVRPEQVIFTSSGTEANNQVFHTFHGRKVITSNVEHASVLGASDFGMRFPVDENGLVSLEQLERVLRSEKTSLLSVILANNETGIIQDIRSIADLAHRYGCLVHTDAIQAVGKISTNFQELGVDYMTVSAHKIGGPKGIGALIVGPDVPIESLCKGGGQERRRRPGTENIYGIVGFAQALEEIVKVDWSLIENLKNHCENMLKKLGIQVIGCEQKRLPNTICAIFPTEKSEMLVMKYDLQNIAVSAGSACSSGKVQKSHVLEAMGDLADSMVRISLGWHTTQDEINRFLEVTRKMITIESEARAA